MNADTPSQTADFVAALRAMHQREQGGYILADPYAGKLTSAKLRVLTANRMLRRLYFRYLYPQSLNSSGVVFARQRYCEDLLLAMAQQGPLQYLLLGAGMDSFAFRCNDHRSEIKIFEMDHPATQKIKRRRVERAGLKGHVEYLPIDFRSQSLVDVLRRSSFDPTLPTFVAWLGVTYYLSEDAIARTLRSLAEVCAAQLDIVFDYIDIRLFDDAFLQSRPDVKAGFDAFADFARQSGEPLISGFNYASLQDLLRKNGWEIKEHLDGDEIARRYFRGTPDNTWPSEFDFLAHSQVQS